MRIWHEQLIPILCQKHLCAMWREGLGAYKIITEDKKGYRNHPATKEFEKCSGKLWNVLLCVRTEMIGRGYNPKPMPSMNGLSYGSRFEWQSLEEQIAHLKTKNCKCNI